MTNLELGPVRLRIAQDCAAIGVDGISIDMLEVSRLASGSYSNLYLFVHPRRSVVYKCRFDDAGGLAPPTSHELIALRTLCSWIAVPELVLSAQPCCSFPHGYFVMSYISGRMPTPSSKFAVAAAKYLANLHSIPIDSVVGVPDGSRHLPLNVVSDCFDLIHRLKSILTTHDLVDFDLSSSAEYIDNLREPGCMLLTKPALTHGDLVPSNFVVSDNNLLYGIDWETFSASTSVVDLCGLLAPYLNLWDWHREFSAAERELFIATYSDMRNLPIPEVRKAIGHAAPVYALKHALWCTYRASLYSVSSNQVLRSRLRLSARMALAEFKRLAASDEYP